QRVCYLLPRPLPALTLFPYTTLFRSMGALAGFGAMLKVWPAMLLLGARRRRTWTSALAAAAAVAAVFAMLMPGSFAFLTFQRDRDRKSTRLNSSHVKISYAVSCLTKN